MEITHPNYVYIEKSYHEKTFKNKANNSGKPADKTAYKRQENSLVKLNKEDKKSFLKKQITENTKKHIFFQTFWKLCQSLFSEKGFHYEH